MIKMKMRTPHTEYVDGYFNEKMINYVEIEEIIENNKIIERNNILNYCQDNSTDFYINDESFEKLKLLNEFMMFPCRRLTRSSNVLVNYNNVFGIIDADNNDLILFKDGSHIIVKHMEKETDDNGNIKSLYYKVSIDIK